MASVTRIAGNSCRVWQENPVGTDVLYRVDYTLVLGDQDDGYSKSIEIEGIECLGVGGHERETWEFRERAADAWFATVDEEELERVILEAEAEGNLTATIRAKEEA